MIRGVEVSKSYTKDIVLDKVSFVLNDGIKVGLVGKNGCGKTTLLRLIIGEEFIDSGLIEVNKNEIGYIPQELKFKNEKIMIGEHLHQFLENPYEEYKFDILKNELDFQNFDIYQTIDTLSEGQKMKIKFMELLLQDKTTILIDEPTNHLDIVGIMWFENFLKYSKYTVLMISHDRQFLNETVDEIWEIDNKKLTVYRGNYDYYRGQKDYLIDKQNKEYKDFLRRKDYLEKFLERARHEGNRSNIRFAKRRIQDEIVDGEKTKYDDRKVETVTFQTDIRKSKLIVGIDDVTKNFGENTLYENLNLEIRGQEKIWLYGPNGTGKTTLVKMIMGLEEPTTGNIRLGVNLKTGYFAQVHEELKQNETLHEEFLKQTGCEYFKSFGYLNNFLFDKSDLDMKMFQLSPGQRARFALSIFSYNDYDFLILDEPTNHLDIPTKEVIEKSLREFKGTLLLISHDRYFVESCNCTRMFNLATFQDIGLV